MLSRRKTSREKIRFLEVYFMILLIFPTLIQLIFIKCLLGSRSHAPLVIMVNNTQIQAVDLWAGHTWTKKWTKGKCVIWFRKESFLRQRVFPSMPVDYRIVFMLKMRVFIEVVFTWNVWSREIIKSKAFVNSPSIANTGLGALGPPHVYNISISTRRHTWKYIHWICEAFLLTLALLKMLTVLLGKLQLLFTASISSTKWWLTPTTDSEESDDLRFR